MKLNCLWLNRDDAGQWIVTANYGNDYKTARFRTFAEAREFIRQIEENAAEGDSGRFPRQ